MRNARANRQQVVADFIQTDLGATRRRGFGAPDRLPGLPPTLAADLQRLKELNFTLNNTDIRFGKFQQTLVEIEIVERRVAQALDGTSEAFRRQEQAAAGAERRLSKIQQIQEYYSGLNPRAGGVRDPQSGAMLARGANAAADERAYRAALGASRELLQVDLQRLQTIRQFTQALKEATAANKASQESGFAAFEAGRRDPVRRSIERNRQKRERDEARQQAQRDTIEADLARVQERRLALGRKPPPPPRPTPKEGGFLSRLGSEGAISSALIGGGFPLLFGQGLGAAAGGGIGGLAGGALGGGFGFGLSIIGTLVGSQFDLIIEKSKALASALQDPIENFDLLKQNAQISTRGNEAYIDSLIQVGREAEAAALIQQDLIRTYGNLKSARDFASAQDRVGRETSKLGGKITELALPGLTQATGGVADIVKDLGTYTDFVRKTTGTDSPEAGVYRFFEKVTTQIYRAVGLNVPDNAGQLLSADIRATRQARPEPALQIPPEIQRDRIDLLETERKLITSQVQGYRELSLAQQKTISQTKQNLDLRVLQNKLDQQTDPNRQAAIGLQIQERTNQGIKERLQLEEELKEIRRQNAVLERTSPGILKQSAALIDAQVNGTRRQQIIEQQRLSTLEAQRALEREGNRDPAARREIREGEARRQAEAAAQLARLDKESAINARFRLPLLRNELDTINAQVAGEERRALVLQRERNLRQAARALQLEREPDARADIRANAAAQELRDRGALLQFDKQRAAAIREINFSAQQEQRSAARSLQFARERAALEAGPARQALETRQGAVGAVAEARDRQRDLQQEADRLLRTPKRLSDAEEIRLLELTKKELPAASNALQLALVTGATALRDAARDLTRQFSEGVLNLTRVRSDPQGVNRFLSPEVQNRRALRDFDLLLPQFRRAQSRLFELTGERGREFSGPTAGVNEALRDFIDTVDREFDANKNLSDITRALNTTNEGLVTVNGQLSESINNLAGKDWSVNVVVASDGSAAVSGDVLNQAAGAL